MKKQLIEAVRTTIRSIKWWWNWKWRGYSLFYAYIIILVSVILFNHFGAPIEYTAQEAHAEEVQAEEVITSAPTEEKKDVEIVAKIDWTRERIDQEIELKAAKYGVKASTLKRIVQCESGYDTDIQSNHILSYGREKSYGLAQIHLPTHPDITYEQAIDPEFAIEYLAKHYAHGTDKWSCK